MNLHDWIDETCDVLDLDCELDEGLILDLAKVVADNVERRAAPISAFLVGVAAGSIQADPVKTEELAARVQALAQAWERPAGTPEVELPDEVPDDSTVDHTGESLDD